MIRANRNGYVFFSVSYDGFLGNYSRVGDVFKFNWVFNEPTYLVEKTGLGRVHYYTMHRGGSTTGNYYQVSAVLNLTVEEKGEDDVLVIPCRYVSGFAMSSGGISTPYGVELDYTKAESYYNHYLSYSDWIEREVSV